MFWARAAREQAVVSNTMEARGQHMDEKAADELVGRQPHHFLPGRAIGAVVLVMERDAGLVVVE